MRAWPSIRRIAAGSGVVVGAVGVGRAKIHCQSRADLQAPQARWSLVSVRDNHRVEDWHASSKSTGFGSKPWSVRKRTLHGGRQEGVDVIEVATANLSFTVVPTRGMSVGSVTVHDKVSGDRPLGWTSPVREIVHPKHVDLQDFGGLGWLTGFSEWLVRCGVAFAGHPGEDGGQLLTLHGRIGNIPASEVEVRVEADGRVCVCGRVDEAMFKFSDYELWTEISTRPGSDTISIRDRIVNRSSYTREYQMIYHTNFGPPLLGAGASFLAPAARVQPFNSDAFKALPTWQTYLGPTAGFGEHVFCVTPHAGADGRTVVALVNAEKSSGVALRYAVDTLPYFTLWKNTDTLEEGYVTGLEPGTCFPSRRPVERAAGRIPTLEPGSEVIFEVDFTVLRDAEAVKETAAEIRKIQGRRPTHLQGTPVT